MALLMEYKLSNLDITIPNCYWKIENENGMRGGKNNISIRMSCYENKMDADNNINILTAYDFHFTPELYSGVNFIAQAYEHVKKIPYFKNAIDA